MRYSIIGAGPAGVIAAGVLRKTDPDSSITIIGAEHEQPYSRMALPYYLTERIDERGTLLKKASSYYSTHRIELIQDRVDSVDTAKKTLALANNEAVAFDKLLIAAGSRPLSPAIPGVDQPGVYNCWTLADARAIIKCAQPGAHVVLIGAGFIGCIILEALVHRKVGLTVVEMEDRMVPRMMDLISGNLVKKWCVERGVTVYTGTSVEAVGQRNGKLDLDLHTGETLQADMVISATGVQANIQFLEDSQIDTDAGVLVNKQLQTNHPDIFAAGDVCQGKDFSTGDYTVQAIQPTAVDHGRIAALNMAGVKTIHQGSINMNVLDTMGLISASYGLWMGVDGGDSVRLCDPDRYRYLDLQFADDILIGAQTLGLTQHIGVLRGLIQTRARLGNWKQYLLDDPTRLMEAYLGATQAIGHNIRLL